MLTPDRRAFAILLWVLLLLAGGLSLPVSAAAKNPSSSALRSRDPGFRERFDDAISAYVDEKFADAEVLFRRLDVETGLSSHDREVITVMIGKCLYGEGAYLDCQRHFDRFRKRHTESVHESAALIYIGHCSYRLRDYNRAAQAYVTGLAIGPDDHRDIALENLEPLVKNGLRTRELEYLLIGLGDDDRANQVRVWIADRWLAAGRQEQAEQLYQRVVGSSKRSASGREAAHQLEDLEHLQTQVLTIGVLCPLSGDFADYGEQVRRAALIAESVNPERVRILIRDTAGDSVRAGRIADSLADLGCRAVIGPLVPEAIQATAPVLKEAGIIQILPLARRGDFTPLSPFLFQMSSSPKRRGRLLAEYATKKERIRRLGILASDTPEGHEAANAFRDAASEAGATVYPAGFFEPGQTDFGEQLRALKNLTADPATKVDANGKATQFKDWVPVLDGMLLWGDPEDFVLAVPQIVFHKFRVKYFGPAGWGETAALDRIHTALDSVVFASDEWVDTTRAPWREFARAYEKKWRSAPSGLSGRVYDLIGWLAAAGDPGDNPEDLVAVLLDAEGYSGTTGHWRFNDQRQPFRTPIYRHRRGAPDQADAE